MEQRRKKLDLIQELTTHKNDYKQWPLVRNEIPRVQISDETLRPRKPVKAPQIDYQSHLEYKRHVPFNLYFDAKPIVGTAPTDPIPQLNKSNFLPKNDHFIYKLPGKMELEITDEDIIRPLLNATYEPIHRRLFKEACLKVPRPPAQPDTVLINENIKFTPQLYPPLPPGWLNAAKHWDSLQSRIVSDPTKAFWMRRGPEVQCFSKSDYREILPKETKQEIRTLIEKDELRLPYTVTKTGYSGYRQMAAKGVPLARNKDFIF